MFKFNLNIKKFSFVTDLTEPGIVSSVEVVYVM